MLKSLSITNYALIDRTEVSFDEGFTVITGETGAGKSILLEALGLVLGSRANFNAIRKGEDKSTVEAIFSYADNAIDDHLRNEGLDVLDDIILRRELTSGGRSRAFINDSPVSLSVLKDVSLLMVDMHGQQENIALQSAAYQMKQLDLYAHNADLINRYASAYHDFKSIQKQIDTLRESAAQVRKDEDYFRFQFEELSQIDLNAEEFESLESELGSLEHAEEIERALSVADSGIGGEEGSSLDALRTVISEIKTIASYSPQLKELYERLHSTQIELEDIQAECSRIQSELESEPGRLEVVRERLDLYNKLLHKHAVNSVEELVEVREEYRIKLEGIESYDSELEHLSRKFDTATDGLSKASQELSGQRKKAIDGFQLALRDQVRKLGMEKAEVELLLTDAEHYLSNGKDHIDMRFDANGNQHFVPLKDSASGGEISRLMLALKSIIASNDNTPTLIFDEVDTGVSGEVAKQIGNLMKSIAVNAQIISVTHLPGVAAKGAHHIRIHKLEEEGRPVSRLECLTDEDRITEIAAMFSGKSLTDASLESARNLLKET